MEIVAETPVALAWMGDAVFSLRVRESLMKKGFRRPRQLQQLNARMCSAQGQQKILQTLEQEQILNEDELEIVRRGRNAHVKSIAKNADPKTYLDATALEALLGYLYLYGHKERLKEILDRCMEAGDLL